MKYRLQKNLFEICETQWPRNSNLLEVSSETAQDIYEDEWWKDDHCTCSMVLMQD